MGRGVLVRGRFGESYVLVDPSEIVRLRGEDEARQFVGQLDAQDVRNRMRPELDRGSDGETGEAGIESLVQGLRTGRLVAVRVREPVRRLEAPTVRPLVDNPFDGPVVEPDRPTWIAIEVVHEGGASLQDIPVSITLPDGEVRTERLDGASKWRADDVRGTGQCTVRLTAPPASDLPRPRPVTLRDDDAWLAPRGSVRLVTGRSHRIVVVGGATTLLLLDQDESPVPGRSCRVILGSRQLEGKTDAEGRFIAEHPTGEAVCDAELVDVPADVCESLGPQS